MEDIDSDDEDPVIVMNLLDLGLKFNVLEPSIDHELMQVFPCVFQRALKDKLPNLRVSILRKRLMKLSSSPRVDPHLRLNLS
mmetsp:Transcript_3324/g.5044  ORF Transcript_3324/g.5044 Transcript_3324/m.5044 type:complete len:82 (-) Transcript_3324:62-307(-)